MTAVSPPLVNRTLALALVAALVLSVPPTVRGARADDVAMTPTPDLMTVSEREALDLSDYVVTDPDASYFDVAERQKFLQSTTDPILTAEVEKLSIGTSCRQLMNLPVLAGRMKLPAFYELPDQWREAAEPFFRFEDAVSHLAASYVATGDTYYADCLGDLLSKWGDEGAFLALSQTPDLPQTWFAAESSLFAAGLAYSIVRPYLTTTRAEDAGRIERWLQKASWSHISREEHDKDSCCNNHFYRRALHAAVIGIVANDDKLFQYGVSAVLSALTEMNPDGGFPREVSRGTLAVHYQNYAMLYLVMIMQLASRQGYDLFDLTVNDNRIETAAEFAINAIENPQDFEIAADTEQELRFIQDDQYFTWMESYLGHHDSERIENFVSTRRPTFNRSAGGFITLYFYVPTEEELMPHVEYVGGQYVTRLRKCSQHPVWYDDRDIAWRAECERHMRDINAGAEPVEQ
jgi:poly(beta-D-mannuronate) lyase